MREFLFGLVEISLTMGAVIALLLALGPVLSRRFQPQWRYWAWLLVALRLAVPLNVSLPAAPVVLEAPALDRPAVEQAAPPVRPAESLEDLPPDTAAVPGFSAPAAGMDLDPDLDTSAAPPPQTALAVQRAPRQPAVSLPLLLTLLWAAGGALFLLAQAGGYLRFVRRVRRWQVWEGTDQGLPVYRCAAVSSPVLAGIFRPRVLLPEGLRGEAETFALLHEHTHYIRHDLWYKLLLVWVNALFWFHPLVWLLRRNAERDLEISCDAQVLRNKDPDYRQRYGAALLSFAAGTGPAAPLTSGFADGMRGLRRRFASLVDTAPKRAGRLALALVLCAAMLGAGLVACQTAEEPGDGIYYSRDPVLAEGVLTFTPLTEEGEGDAPISFPLAEAVQLPMYYGDMTARYSRNEIVARLISSLKNSNILYDSIGRLSEIHSTYQPSGTEALMITVEEGQVTAVKWVSDPHLDEGDGVYYGVIPDLRRVDEGLLTFTQVPYLPLQMTVSLEESELREITFPLSTDQDAKALVQTRLGLLNSQEQLEEFLGLPDNETSIPFHVYYTNPVAVLTLEVKQGEITYMNWRFCSPESEPVESGTYYALVNWELMMSSGVPYGVMMSLFSQAPDTWDDLRPEVFPQYLPVIPSLQENLLELLYEPLLTWEPQDELFLQVTVENGVITDLSWTDLTVPEMETFYTPKPWDEADGIDAFIRGVDLEAGTVTWSTYEDDHAWDIKKELAPGALVRLWDIDQEGWVDASLEELAQRVAESGRNGLACRTTERGNRIVTIRETSPWESADLEDGIYYLGRRIRWGDVTWDTPDKPIAAIEAPLYELDLDTGHVLDSSTDMQLMVSRNVVCYNEDGSLWEGDLASFLEAFNADAQALRQARKHYLTWPLNDILTLEAVYQRGLILELRRMPPPEL